MRPWLLVALLTQLLLSLGYTVHTPAFEGPDENDHAYYASHLAHKRTLPIVLRSGSAWDHAALGHHPPLYYALLAGTLHLAGAADTIPSWIEPPRRDGPWQWQHGYDEVAPVSREIRTLWLLRGWSVLCGLLTVLLTHRLARLAWPDAPAVADTAALLLACLPQWSFTHGVLDNGNLATTLSTATLAVLAGGLAQRRLGVGRGLALGVLTGLALVTKLTSLFLLPLLGVAYAVALLREHSIRRTTLASGLAALGAIAALAGWFFARNLRLYGDPLAQDAHRAAFAMNRVPDGMVWDYLTGSFLPQLGASFVGNVGWVSLAVPAVVLWAWGVVAVLAALGGVAGARLGVRRSPLLLLLGATALVLLQVVKFNTDFFQPQGRYAFPAAGALCILAAAGLVALARRARPLPHAAVVLLALVPPATGCALLLLWFAPAFRIEPYGVDRERAALVAGLATPPPPARATVELLAPADGAQLESAPTFRWDTSPLPPASRCTLHVFTARGRVLFGTYEWAGLALTDGVLMLPDGYWAMIPTGEELLWKVRRLPDRAAGEGVDDVPESPPRRFTKVR